ncbi:putative GNAT family acetyltransferase [Hypoxylon sp. FL1284]|nr:putative GNAT family acetyltransferase [Hypoxylon sp. FL1284]
MTLILTFAGRDDAARIADIHLAAFGSNEMLLAQFPTPTVRAALRKSIQAKALADTDDPKTTVLVVRHVSSVSLNNVIKAREDRRGSDGGSKGKVIAFAKWTHPISREENYTEPPWVWPAGTDLKILQDWTKVTEQAQARVVGDSPCYHLTFIGTDPAYERRGAATMMVQWGIDQSKQDQALAYIESTLTAAPLYRKLGFIEAGKLSLGYQAAGTGAPRVYEEISFVYPKSLIGSE